MPSVSLASEGSAGAGPAAVDDADTPTDGATDLASGPNDELPVSDDDDDGDVGVEPEHGGSYQARLRSLLARLPLWYRSKLHCERGWVLAAADKVEALGRGKATGAVVVPQWVSSAQLKLTPILEAIWVGSARTAKDDVVSPSEAQRLAVLAAREWLGRHIAATSSRQLRLQLEQSAMVTSFTQACNRQSTGKGGAESVNPSVVVEVVVAPLRHELELTVSKAVAVAVENGTVADLLQLRQDRGAGATARGEQRLTKSAFIKYATVRLCSTVYDALSVPIAEVHRLADHVSGVGGMMEVAILGLYQTVLEAHEADAAADAPATVPASGSAVGSVLTDLFSTELLPAERFEAIGLFFAAPGLVAASAVAEELKETYDAVRAARRSFEIVWVCSDLDESGEHDPALRRFDADLPWPVVPFIARDLRARLCACFAAERKVKLAVVTAAGEVLNASAVPAMRRGDPAETFPWAAPDTDARAQLQGPRWKCNICGRSTVVSLDACSTCGAASGRQARQPDERGVPTMSVNIVTREWECQICNKTNDQADGSCRVCGAQRGRYPGGPRDMQVAARRAAADVSAHTAKHGASPVQRHHGFTDPPASKKGGFGKVIVLFALGWVLLISVLALAFASGVVNLGDW